MRTRDTRLISCGLHGNIKETCGGGSKVQPAACASASEMPANQNATCAKAMPPIRMTGSPNVLRERCQVR